MKITMIALASLLGLAACAAAPNVVYCPQGYDNATRCHAGDNHEGPSRESRGESDGPSRGDNDDGGSE